MAHLSYQQHFDQRGSAYDKAMRAFPGARVEEFDQVVSALALRPGMVVADVPAGGGYLRDFLPASCHWLGHEPSASFGHHGAAISGAEALLPLPWADGSVDVAISLAGVHHLQDKTPLYRELLRVVRPDGHLVLSDVCRDSPVARFLDGFIGDHNSTGHEGIYLDHQTAQQLQAAGWHVLSCRQNHFHWRFEDRAAMAAFCQQLFDLRAVNHARIVAAIEQELGVSERADGLVGMHWSLQTLVARKP